VRWISFEFDGKESFGFLGGDQSLVDVGRKADFPDLKSAIAADALADLADKHAGGAILSLEDIRYLPVIPNPDKILCVGLNYKAHQEETGRGGEGYPTIFARFSASQMGHLEPMIRPRESASLDYEGEIAMIIGKPGRRISTEEAYSHIAGFSIYNDGSVREYQRHTTQYIPGKNFCATGGFGPWMMTVDEIGDLDAMEITTRLNGKVMQNAKASLLVHGFAELIEYCSTFTDLVAGDVIVTGTPGGVGGSRTPPVFMDDGDLIEVEVKPIGTLVNPVVAD
jgi:2-keto-4-pentenoate hydratase/2-oxohepta-3-ene-1,7-dioic acid hydratase in catechol pathway